MNERGHPGRQPSAVRQDFVAGTNICIFTDQFLEHSRGKFGWWGPSLAFSAFGWWGSSLAFSAFLSAMI